MEDIESRLRQTADTCLASYGTWKKDQKDSKALEELQDAIHELRKVAARMEIELAISERNEMTQRPIPIPPHRDSRNRSAEGDAEDRQPDFNHDMGSQGGHGGGGGRPNNMKRHMRNRRPGGGRDQG